MAQVGGVLVFKSGGPVGRTVMYLTGIDEAKNLASDRALLGMMNGVRGCSSGLGLLLRVGKGDRVADRGEECAAEGDEQADEDLGEAHRELVRVQGRASIGTAEGEIDLGHEVRLRLRGCVASRRILALAAEFFELGLGRLDHAGELADFLGDADTRREVVTLLGEFETLALAASTCGLLLNGKVGRCELPLEAVGVDRRGPLVGLGQRLQAGLVHGHLLRCLLN